MNDIYINSAWSTGEGPAFESINPANGTPFWSGHTASPAQVSAAVTAARIAFHDWSRTSLSERVTVLRAYADALKTLIEDIATTISQDMGKALWESRLEAGAMAAKVEMSITAFEERTGERTGSAAFGSTFMTHRPHGVMAVIGPFNFPGHLPNGHIIPALLAGNTCVFKPSELAPAVAKLMAKAFDMAGLPKGCVNIVHGGRATGAALLDAKIDGLLFTGSMEAGVHFHRHFAGRPEIMLALEMGGNNPLIIWEPADIEAAADIAFQSGYLTTGQRCSCARRLILPTGRFGDAVIEALIARIEATPIGVWDKPDIFMGPLVSAHAAQNALNAQDARIALGATALRAMTSAPHGQAFVTPGLIDVSGVNGIADAEIFAPLLSVIRVTDFDAALEAANATRFGLSGGLVSDDDDLWTCAHNGLRAGILNRNRPTAGASSAQPFGGPGLSGNHRPSAYYAADYCAWPQASQIAPSAERLKTRGF